MHRLSHATSSRAPEPPPDPPQSPPRTPRARWRGRWGLGALALAGAAVVGAGASLVVVAATGNLGGDRVRETVIVREGAELPTSSDTADAPASPGPPRGLAALIEGAAPAVPVVIADADALGSAFLLDDERHLLTNEHVVGDAEQVELEYTDGSSSTARVLGTDPSSDLAVLEAESVPAGTRPLSLGRSASLRVGTGVVAIGNPFGLERSATSGIVSATERVIRAPDRFAIQNAIQTDAAINVGNSGGPLLDLRGRVVGVIAQIATENRTNVGVAFAVPIDSARPIAESIIESGTPEHAWIGISGDGVTPETASDLGVTGHTGVAILEVDDRGPARKAGLKGARDASGPIEGADVIISADGVPVADMADVSRAVSDKRVGERITFVVLRDGDRVETTLTLADRPEDVGRRP